MNRRLVIVRVEFSGGCIMFQFECIVVIQILWLFSCIRLAIEFLNDPDIVHVFIRIDRYLILYVGSVIESIFSLSLSLNLRLLPPSKILSSE